jgi:hypothetical protein
MYLSEIQFQKKFLKNADMNMKDILERVIRNVMCFIALNYLQE